MESQASHSSDQRLVDPSTGSSSPKLLPSGRSMPRSARPSAPLSPVPVELSTSSPSSESHPIVATTTATSNSPLNDSGETRIAKMAGTGVKMNDTDTPQYPLRPGIFDEARRPGASPQNQGTKEEFGEKILPASEHHLRLPASLPLSRSGLFKRLTTRLAGTRSSPSLRPAAASPGSCSSAPLDTLHTQQEDGGEGSGSHPTSPGRLQYPTSDEKTGPALPPMEPSSAPSQAQPRLKLQQSVNSRLSLAALGERRAEKREAKARERQGATNARRAAALAEMGLLPASRRYSVMPLLAREGDRGPLFDPFVKDEVRKEERGEEETDATEQRFRVADGDIGGLSAAEAVIREWREKNSLGNDTASKGEVLPVDSDTHLAQVQAESPSTPHSTGPSTSVTLSVEKGPQLSVSTPSDVRCSDSSAPSPTPALNERVSLSHIPPSKEPLNRIPVAETITLDDNAGNKGDGKAMLGSWRFPTVPNSPEPTRPSEDTVTNNGKAHSPASQKAAMPESPGLTTPRAGNAGMSFPMASPVTPRSVSSASTAVVRPTDPLVPKPDTAPPTPPPKSTNDFLKHGSGTREKTTDARISSSIVLSGLQPPRSPTQIPFPASPTRTGSSSPDAQCFASSPALPTPARRGGVQKCPTAPPTISRGLSLSIPALSPTTSTSTSTSGGSTAPRTPSTSSHGHSPVCILDAPMEHEEDTLLSYKTMGADSAVLHSSDWDNSRVKEFGELANQATLDDGRHEEGALPPLPLSASREAPGVSMSIPVMKRPAEDNDKRRRTTLFGRRRTAPNGPPMIAIPETTAGLTAGGQRNATKEDTARPVKPRQTSSLTNLRRTVTSVAAGLSGAAGVGLKSSSKTSSPSMPSQIMIHSPNSPQRRRDREPSRGATIPKAKPRVSPHSELSSDTPDSASFPSGNRRSGTGVGLRAQPLNPTMHSRGSILLEAHAIEDEESRRLSELAFLD